MQKEKYIYTLLSLLLQQISTSRLRQQCSLVTSDELTESSVLFVVVDLS